MITLLHYCSVVSEVAFSLYMGQKHGLAAILCVCLRDQRAWLILHSASTSVSTAACFALQSDKAHSQCAQSAIKVTLTSKQAMRAYVGHPVDRRG